jgi:DNA-binding NtrC family response regulator
VKQGRFREDLFYRLHVFPITVPPLRDRPADIPALARHFLALFAAEEGKRIRAIAPDALQLLMAYHWPGNIRQLENAVFRAVVLAEADTVGLEEFPQITAQVGNAVPSQDAVQSPDPDAAAAWAEDLAPALIPVAFHEEPHSGVAAALPPVGDALPLLDAEGEVRPLEQVESDLIRYAVTHYRGQMSEVARRLQIGRSTLYRRLEALGLNTERSEIDS